MAANPALTRILRAAVPRLVRLPFLSLRLGRLPLVSLLLCLGLYLGLGWAAPTFAGHLPAQGTAHSAVSGTAARTTADPAQAAKPLPGIGGAAKAGAEVFLAPEYILQNDKLLKAYAIKVAPNATANGVSPPGLLGIAREAHRNQIHAGPDEASSLADAMRHAVWRKKAAA